MIYNGLESQALYGDTAPKPAVYGIYEVEDFVINNDTLPPMLKDTVRWRYIVLDKGDAGSVFKMQTTGYKSMIYFRSKTDSINKHISFLSYQDSTEVGKFKYYKTDSIHYAFEGVFKNDTIKLNTIRTDEKDYLLTNRGFHWVNEYPYNR